MPVKEFGVFEPTLKLHHLVPKHNFSSVPQSYPSCENVPKREIAGVGVFGVGPVPILVKPVQYLRHGEEGETAGKARILR